MFNRKQRIIETQKAIIADLREEIDHKDRIIAIQHERLFNLIEQVNALKTINKVNNIDFPNSEKGGLYHTGAVNIDDILQN